MYDTVVKQRIKEEEINPEESVLERPFIHAQLVPDEG